MTPTKTTRVVRAPLVVEAPVAPRRSRLLPSAETYEAYKAEFRTLAVVVAALIVAAAVSLNTERSTDSLSLIAPIGSTQQPESPADRVRATTPSTVPATPAPQTITVVTVPVPAPAPVVIRDQPAKTPPTTKVPVPRYENGGTPPVVRITKLGPQNQDAGSTVELTFQAGDADGVIFGWIVDWGDGSNVADTYDDRCGPQPGEPDHEFPSQHHSYRQIGTYQVSVVVVSRGTCGAGPTQRASDQGSLQVGPAVVAQLPVQ